MATRAAGQAKYLFEYEGETFFTRQVRALSQVTDEIIISCRDQQQVVTIPDYHNYIIVTDEKKGEGPSEGLRTGVYAARGELIAVIACDMPLISTDIIALLFSRIGSADAAIPVWENGHQEPLHAVYRRDSLIGYFSRGSSRKLRGITSDMNVVLIPVAELRRIDPMLLSFTNINDLDEYRNLTGKKE
jgi:molybdopterin-guanine dinucleotide biosynthesis protein A